MIEGIADITSILIYETQMIFLNYPAIPVQFGFRHPSKYDLINSPFVNSYLYHELDNYLGDNLIIIMP